MQIKRLFKAIWMANLAPDVRKILALSQDKTIDNLAAKADGIMIVSKLAHGAEVNKIRVRKIDDPGQMQLRQPWKLQQCRVLAITM